jgi:hypothetical protein
MMLEEERHSGGCGEGIRKTEVPDKYGRKGRKVVRWKSSRRKEMCLGPEDFQYEEAMEDNNTEV